MIASIGVILCNFFAACSQILLKKSADTKWESNLKKFTNMTIILAYFIFLGSAFFSSILNNYLDYKIISAFSSAGYIFVIILSKFVLKEKIEIHKIIGCIFIVLGIIIFSI